MVVDRSAIKRYVRGAINDKTNIKKHPGIFMPDVPTLETLYDVTTR
jgi:hypothetical protein